MIDIRRWRSRILVAGCTWLAMWGFTTLRGSNPQPWLLALVAVAAVAVGGVVIDARAAVSAADWRPAHRANPRQWGLDPRFSRLSRSFTDGTDPQLVADQVHASLCGVVDGLLIARHGIDRQQAPEAARGVLGDDVADYLNGPAHYSRGYFEKLPSLLTAMEAL